MPEMTSLQVQFVCFGTIGVATANGLSLPEEPGLELLHDGLRDFVLNCEHIRKLAIVTLRPNVIAICNIDQLYRHPQPVAGAPHAPFDDAIDAELRADL